MFLVVPGSGLLRFNGLPLSSKIEFTVFAISLVALFSGKSRGRCKALLSWRKGKSNQWLFTILLAAIALKFFTFVLAPIGNGFESCYRSVYAPLNQEIKCEKSFEAPFLLQMTSITWVALQELRRRSTLGRRAAVARV